MLRTKEETHSAPAEQQQEQQQPQQRGARMLTQGRTCNCAACPAHPSSHPALPLPVSLPASPLSRQAAKAPLYAQGPRGEMLHVKLNPLQWEGLVTILKEGPERAAGNGNGNGK